MNRAIRVTASLLGLSAGIAAVEHGYFELLQGSARPEGLFIASIGPPCQPELVWNNCEPALTIIPHFALTGILAIILGLITIIWSAFFIQRKHGGLLLILFSIGLLLFGGGLFPPLIGMIAGLTGTRINKPLTWWRAHSTGSVSRLLVKLYPWALIAYLVLVYGQFITGYFFNEFLMSVMGINVLIFMGLLVTSVFSAFAHDAQDNL
jgi:hypothetical protein